MLLIMLTMKETITADNANMLYGQFTVIYIYVTLLMKYDTTKNEQNAEPRQILDRFICLHAFVKHSF